MSPKLTKPPDYLWHYDCFWEILSQNWGMIFYSCGVILIQVLQILASKAQKTADDLPGLKIFQIEAKLHL